MNNGKVQLFSFARNIKRFRYVYVFKRMKGTKRLVLKGGFDTDHVQNVPVLYGN